MQTTSSFPLPRSTPESQGIASSAIMAFLTAAEHEINDLHSLMLLRHGQVVAEGWWAPYASNIPHMLFSLSKSFTSTAVGLAVAEGRLSVDDAVLDFFPEDAPEVIDEHLAAMRVRHLLSMSTGHAEDTTRALHTRADGNWVKAFLAQPVAYKPGTHFLYNSGASYMLSAIIQRLTGMTLLDYLRPRLLDPLGIEHASWESCPRGINTGGWGLSITTEGIACFGQLYLQKGMWQGVRLVPEAWVEEATAKQISNGSREDSDWEQGYGYQFWRCRYGAYRGDGAFGQFCVVLPDQDAVVAITAGVSDMQAALNLVWMHLLPAMEAAPLPENQSLYHELSRKLASLSLVPLQGEHAPALAAQVTGKRYCFALDDPANEQKLESIVFDFDNEGCTVTMHNRHGVHKIAAGAGVWRKGVTMLEGGKPQPIAASGAWTAPDTYQMRLYFYETPFCLTLASRFAEGELVLDSSLNVNFGPTGRPRLLGRLSER